MFLPNIPGGTFIPGATSIPESRVSLKTAVEFQEIAALMKTKESLSFE